MTENQPSFEERLQKVESMIDGIESGKLSLEDSVKQYEEGMKLLGDLEKELAEMNRRLTILKEGKEQDFPAGESNEII